MLISQNKFNKKQSVYKCDRCNEQLSIETKVAVYIGLPSRTPKKKWDLCKKCYGALVRGINKNK